MILFLENISESKYLLVIDIVDIRKSKNNP